MTNYPDERSQAFKSSRIDEELETLANVNQTSYEQDNAQANKQRLLHDLSQVYAGGARQRERDLDEVWRCVASSTSYVRYVRDQSSMREEAHMQQEKLFDNKETPVVPHRDKQPAHSRRGNRLLHILGPLAAILCVVVIVGSFMLVSQTLHGGNSVGGHDMATPTTAPSPTSTPLDPKKAPRGTLLYSQTDKDATAINVISWNRDGQTLLTTGTNIKIWDTRTQKLPVTQGIPGSANFFYASWSPDGSKYAFALSNLEIRDKSGMTICSSSKPLSSTPSTGHVLSASQPLSTHLVASGSSGQTLAWSPDGKYIAANSMNNSANVVIYDMNCHEVKHIPIATGHANDIQWSADGRYITTSWEDGSVIIDDFLDQTSGYGISGAAGGPVTRARLSPDGKYVAFLDPNAKLVKIWELGDGGISNMVYTYHPTMTPSTLDWSPGGQNLIIGSHSSYDEKTAGKLDVVDWKKRQTIYTFNTDYWITAAALSPDDTKIALGGEYFERDAKAVRPAPLQVIKF